MSKPRPMQSKHFWANLIWGDVPSKKICEIKKCAGSLTVFDDRNVFKFPVKNFMFSYLLPQEPAQKQNTKRSTKKTLAEINSFGSTTLFTATPSIRNGLWRLPTSDTTVNIIVIVVITKLLYLQPCGFSNSYKAVWHILRVHVFFHGLLQDRASFLVSDFTATISWYWDGLHVVDRPNLMTLKILTSSCLAV
jgi:hypothetical protein